MCRGTEIVDTGQTHKCQAVDVLLLRGNPKLSCRAGVGEGGEHKDLARPQ